MKKRDVSAPKQVSKASNNHHPSHDRIAIRAYEIYIMRGAYHGRDLDDWLQAERELIAKNHTSARPQAAAV